MHELSLCEAIAHKVRAHAAGRPVRAVMVRIGYFRQVVPDAMLFSWEVLTSAPSSTAARSRSSTSPRSSCAATAGPRPRSTHPTLVCRTCEGHNVDLTTGDEFLVVALEIAEA